MHACLPQYYLFHMRFHPVISQLKAVSGLVLCCLDQFCKLYLYILYLDVVRHILIGCLVPHLGEGKTCINHLMEFELDRHIFLADCTSNK